MDAIGRVVPAIWEWFLSVTLSIGGWWTGLSLGHRIAVAVLIWVVLAVLAGLAIGRVIRNREEPPEVKRAARLEQAHRSADIWAEKELATLDGQPLPHGPRHTPKTGTRVVDRRTREILEWDETGRWATLGRPSPVARTQEIRKVEP